MQTTYIPENFVQHPIESHPLFGIGGGSGAATTDGLLDGAPGAGGRGGGAIILHAAHVSITTNLLLSADGEAGTDVPAESDLGGGGGGGGGFARLLYRVKSGAGTVSATANGGAGGDQGALQDGSAGDDGIAIVAVV